MEGIQDSMFSIESSIFREGFLEVLPAFLLRERLRRGLVLPLPRLRLRAQPNHTYLKYRFPVRALSRIIIKKYGKCASTH